MEALQGLAMSERLKGFAHEEIADMAKEVFAASDKILGRTPNRFGFSRTTIPTSPAGFSTWSPRSASPTLDVCLHNPATIKTSTTNA